MLDVKHLSNFFVFICLCFFPWLLGPVQSTGVPSPECQDVAEVVAQLQARLGQQLWPREQPSLAHPMVPSAAAVALFVQAGARLVATGKRLWTCQAAV